MTWISEELVLKGKSDVMAVERELIPVLDDKRGPRPPDKDITDADTPVIPVLASPRLGKTEDPRNVSVPVDVQVDVQVDGALVVELGFDIVPPRTDTTAGVDENPDAAEFEENSGCQSQRALIQGRISNTHGHVWTSAD